MKLLCLSVKNVCKTYEIKMNNLLVDVEFSHFTVKKLYFKQSLNNISGNCGGPLFSQINFDKTYFGVFMSERFLARGFLSKGLLFGGFLSRGLRPRTHIPISPNYPV